MPNFVLNYLIKPNRIKHHLKNLTMTYIALYLVGFYDLVRERIMKPVYRSLPLNFKVWYDRARYKCLGRFLNNSIRAIIGVWSITIHFSDI